MLFITRTRYRQLCVEFDVDSQEHDSDENEDPQWEERVYVAAGESDEESEEEMERGSVVHADPENKMDVDLDGADEDVFDTPAQEPMNVQRHLSTPPSARQAQDKQRRVKRKKKLTRIEARDRWHLVWFICTKKCRRIPWDRFYDNENKGASF